MNYIELINNFWASDWSYNFNSTEIALYFSILNHANKARWPESFSLPNSVLLVSLKCTKDHLIRARRRLCKASLIKYRNGDRFNPGKYTIIAHLSPTRYVPDACSMESSHVTEKEDLESFIHGQDDKVDKQPLILDESPTRSQCVPDTHPSLPNNINKTKLNKTKHKNHRLSKDNLSVELTDDGYESIGETPVSCHEKDDEQARLNLFSEGFSSSESISPEVRCSESDPYSPFLEAEESAESPSNQEGCANATATVPYERIRKAFIDLCPSLPPPKESSKWSNSRKRNVRCRWNQYPSIEFWEDYFDKVERSDFLSGRSTHWRADFDWLMKSSNFEKIIEGKYTNRGDRMIEMLKEFMETGV